MSSNAGKMAQNSSLTPSFNPYGQNLTMRLTDGSQTSFSVADIDQYYFYSVNIVINYAAQMGASLMLLIALALLTKTDTRWKPMFWLNCGSLLFNFLRLLFMCLYFVGPFNEAYAYFSGDFSMVPSSAYGVSIAAEVFAVILVVLLEALMWFQVMVVCHNLRKRYFNPIFYLSILAAFAAIILRVALCFMNSQAILGLYPSELVVQVEQDSLNATTASIFWFSAIFASKLGYALSQRKKLGLRPWGPMKVLFITACQTLTVPAFFAILQYCPTGIPSMESNVLTSIVIFLPLSTLWACTTTAGERRPAHQPFGSIPNDNSSRSSSLISMIKRGNFKASPSSTVMTSSTAFEPRSTVQNEMAGSDIDLENFQSGVHVENR